MGYQIPREPSADGTILSQAGRPTVGVWLMPDNRLPGMLEDFVQLLVPAGDDLWSHACEAVVSIPAGSRRFKPVHTAKADLHTWLAWQERPGVPMGTALTARYLDGTAPHAARLVDWMRRLYYPTA